MDAAVWMKGFRLTHEKARLGQLVPDERSRYLGMCEELARSWLASQGQEALPGKSARESFSVPQVFQVEVSNLYKTVTREISLSRFVATLSQEFKRGDSVSYALSLGRSFEPITGQAIVASILRQGGASRVTFEFGKMRPEDAERLEIVLFDSLLARVD